MKKTVAIFALVFAIGATAFAQEVVKKVDKTKKTTTVPQKVHNTFSKNKEYNGTKTKHVVKVEKKKP